MALTAINLDDSYPIDDPNHETNTSGVVRFIDGTDANGLSAMQRYQGDMIHRSVLLEAKLNELIDSFNSNPYLKSFDSSTFLRTNGSNALTQPQAGVSPTADEHLTTKGWVAAQLATYQAQITALSAEIASLSSSLPSVRKSDWVEHTWSSGTKQHVEFSLLPLSSAITDFTLDNVVSVSVVERLNLGTEETPVYTYISIVAGASTGFKIDSMWISDESPDVLNVLIPNDVFFPDGYPVSSGYEDITDPAVSRSLRATVFSMLGC